MGIRIYEAAKKFKMSSSELVDLLLELGYKGKTNALATLKDDMLKLLEKRFASSKKPDASPKSVSKKEVISDSPHMKDKQEEPVPEKKAPEVSIQPEDPPQKPSKKSLKGEKKTEKPYKSSASYRHDSDDDELESADGITIINTTGGKKAEKVQGKKKPPKGKARRAPFSKKVQAELQEEERQKEETLTHYKHKSEETEVSDYQRLQIPPNLTVTELAKYLDVEPVVVVKKLFSMGIVASLNQRLDKDNIQLVGAEFGKDIVFRESVFEEEPDEAPDAEDELVPRPPVVTVMGHVDHGKTSLIDYIRKAHVAAGEAGGITQHIGAYQVKVPSGGVITFIDTPGHEAFTAMRAQGAMVTDLAILIVAADDGVQPQTVEAIHHAQAANVHIIVAINKIDKPEANVDRVKQQLMQHNLIAEEWGGQVTMVPISAKKGTGIDDLLEMVLLQAEMLELKANPKKHATGVVIEARLEHGMGATATVLVRNGTIRKGDDIICGTSFGRVKALINDAGKRVKEAGPAMPIKVMGLNDVPRVGDQMAVVESAKFARYVGELRQQRDREERLARDNKIKLADLFKRVTEGEAKELNIIIKADVQGSAGAIRDSLEGLGNDEVKVNVIHSAVGPVVETDVNLASASNAIIVGFHVRVMPHVMELAKAEGVEIKTFRIIYDIVDAVKMALKGLYEPVYEEEVIGSAEVRKVYKVSGVGSICGSYVLHGIVNRQASVRVMRDGIEVYAGKLGSLKRFKDDVREVNSGYECGISVQNFNDVKEGDVLEFFKLKEVERTI
ncbi:MAG: translation initiation factor IF-2 [Candidatus Riflebacteria bacterium]|nr:translation initiation factor IF-2 [Candidatus Riflebacteria bacterium]